MQIFEVAQKQQYPSGLQAILDLADQVAAISPDMRVPEQSPVQQPVVQQTQRDRIAVALSPLDHEARKDARVLSREQLLRKYGQSIADRAITAIKSEAPTPREVFTKHLKQQRENNRELGRGLVAAGVVVQHHSVQDYTRVILAQLDSFLEGVILSDSALLRIAFPDDPAKAKSIGNSRNGKRYKQAWGSPAVMNHPMEKAMQRTHNRHDMNRRLTARTFGQSLSMNAVLFKSSDRDKKQDAEIAQLKREVALLKQQMQETKVRESLDDAGCTTSRDKVLALHSQGKGPTAIASALGMNRDTVKSIIRRSKVG